MHIFPFFEEFYYKRAFNKSQEFFLILTFFVAWHVKWEKMPQIGVFYGNFYSKHLLLLGKVGQLVYRQNQDFLFCYHGYNDVGV